MSRVFTDLIGLGDIGEDAVDHGHKHPGEIKGQSYMESIHRVTRIGNEGDKFWVILSSELLSQ